MLKREYPNNFLKIERVISIANLFFNTETNKQQTNKAEEATTIPEVEVTRKKEK